MEGGCSCDSWIFARRKQTQAKASESIVFLGYEGVWTGFDWSIYYGGRVRWRWVWQGIVRSRGNGERCAAVETTAHADIVRKARG